MSQNNLPGKKAPVVLKVRSFYKSLSQLNNTGINYLSIDILAVLLSFAIPTIDITQMQVDLSDFPKFVIVRLLGIT